MKEKLGKVLEFAKKHLVSLIYAVIVLAAVGAIFWPINGQYEDLTNRLKERKALYSGLQSTLNKPRQTPVIPGQAAEQTKLDHFPTKAVITQWQAVVDQIKKESDLMFAAAVELNKGNRTPLVPNLLPDASQTYAKTQFRNAYKTQMELTDENNRKVQITKDLRAGFKPSQAAISEAKIKLEQQRIAEANKDVDGKPLDPQFDAALAKEKETLPQKLDAEIAQTCVIYVDTDALDPYPVEMMTLNAAANPEPAAFYVAQLNYWIQKDVIDSLQAVNKDAKNVAEAPVKHLKKIKFSSTAWAPLLAAAPPADAAGQSDVPSSEWKQVFTNSPSGRETNGVYDVYRFGVRLFVDASCIDQVIRELTRNKLINVLSCDVISRDTTEYQTKGYFYGDRPIVQLDLQCEELMLRKWTSLLMPPSVRTALGVKPADKAS